MRKLFIFLITISFQSFSNDATSSDNQTNYEIEEVVAIGIRPGPELWKVSNGENELWILGTLSPLPKKMIWHTQIVEEILKDSQVLILPPAVTAKIGFFQSISLAASAIGIKKNPKKQKLKDLMPAELYARWSVLKKKYIGKDRGIEKIRPIFASEELFQKAIKKIGLKSETGINKKVRKMAKKNKLELISPKITLDLNKPKAAMKKFKKSELSDLECFTKIIERIEIDLESMRLRAFAWAYGDITKIKNLPYPDDDNTCTNVILNSDIARDVGVTNIRSRLRAIWIEEAKKALTHNKSTFALLPIRNLLSENNYLNDLSALGYVITVPK